MKIKINQGVEMDTDDLSVDEIRQLKLDTEENVTVILLQIDEAKARVWTTGEYADPEWMARAKAALRFKRRIIQQLQEELSIRRKAHNVGSQPLSQFFMDVCRERMDPALFERVMQEAIERRRRAQEQYLEARRA